MIGAAMLGGESGEMNMQTVLLALVMTLSMQARPAASLSDVDVPSPVVGGALGALGGAVALGGGALAFSANCVSNSQACPWGDDGGAMIGALAVVPAATIFGAIVGGVTGAVIAARLEHDEQERSRLAFEARQRTQLALLRAPGPLPPVLQAPPPPPSTPPPPPSPDAAARVPDNVDVEADDEGHTSP